MIARAAVAAGVLLLVACSVNGTDSGPTAADPLVPATTTATSVEPSGPLHDPDRITPDDVAAIALLGDSGAREPEHAHGHSQVPVTVEAPFFTGEGAIFADQWLAAERAAARFDTIDEAVALGFVRTSSPGPGVGTHWVRWPTVLEPFDPTEPAMVLFDERHDPPRLVAYVYWLQSPIEPEGFPGANDEWHQHTGLCIVNGWTLREEAESAEACPGTYLAGGDLWMLHAWAVPGWDNPLGRFANIHPALCPSRYGTPDVLRCPES